jgi:hypothetical protein
LREEGAFTIAFISVTFSSLNHLQYILHKTLISSMASTSPLEPSVLFGVKGLVAVVTGGATGKCKGTGKEDKLQDI